MSGVAVREYASAEEVWAAARARSRVAVPVVHIPARAKAETPARVVGSGRWTPSEDIRLRTLINRNASRQEMVCAIGRSYEGIQDRAKRLGLTISAPAPLVPRSNLTRDQIQHVIRSVAQGAKYAVVADRLGVSCNVISGIVYRYRHAKKPGGSR